MASKPQHEPEYLGGIRSLARYAEGCLRDEVGPDAAKVVMRLDQDFVLYGQVQDGTRGAFEALEPVDQAKVVAMLGAWM